MGARGDGPDAHDDARQSSTRRRRRATTADTSPVMPIALVTAFDAHATMAEARCTLPATAAVDGNPDSLHRLVPLVSALRAIARNVPGTDMTDEDIQQTLQIAATSLESVVLKSWHRGQRGRKSRVRHEATTDEIIAQLEAVQKRKENDPERKQRAIDALNRRLKYVKKLQRKMERGELLKYTFTVRNLMDVIKALFHQKKSKQGCPQGQSRPNLEPIIDEAWPELLEYENKASVQALSHASAARAHKPGRRVTTVRARARATTTATVRMVTTMTPRTTKNRKRESLLATLCIPRTISSHALMRQRLQRFEQMCSAQSAPGRKIQNCVNKQSAPRSDVNQLGAWPGRVLTLKRILRTCFESVRPVGPPLRAFAM